MFCLCFNDSHLCYLSNVLNPLNDYEGPNMIFLRQLAKLGSHRSPTSSFAQEKNNYVFLSSRIITPLRWTTSFCFLLGKWPLRSTSLSANRSNTTTYSIRSVDSITTLFYLFSLVRIQTSDPSGVDLWLWIRNCVIYSREAEFAELLTHIYLQYLHL